MSQKTATINNGRSLAPCQSSPSITLNPSVFGLVICLISISGAVEHFSSGEVETTFLLVSHCLEKVIRGALKHHRPPPPIIGFVCEFIVTLIKRLKCTQTAIKVYISHKELCLSCFLIVSSPMNAILVSFNVLVSQLLRRRQGKTRLSCAARRKSYKSYFSSTPIAPNLHLSIDQRFSFLEKVN